MNRIVMVRLLLTIDEMCTTQLTDSGKKVVAFETPEALLLFFLEYESLFSLEKGG